MSGKYALIIANTEYDDPGLAQLRAPGKDAEDFARVLNAQGFCAFDDVNLILNQPEHIVRGAIDEFFDQKRPDDLLVLYFSGHGVRDDLGALYLAVKNTSRTRLRSTAVKSNYIREAMDQSRSRRQVLILDCCNSGAFEQGTKSATGVSIGTASAFEAGYGRIILTASDSTQFAWEGDKLTGETENSLFTHFLVKGLEGEADLDSDGRITVDELYDYAYEKVKVITPKQTPSKFSSKQQGEIVLRQITRMEDIKPVSLPDQLISEIENPYMEVRLRAVAQLTKLLNGKSLGLARSAREALEKMEKEDDSRTVSQAALEALQVLRHAEQSALHKAEQDRLAAEAEAERKANEDAERLLASQKAEADRKAKEEAERLLAWQKTEQDRVAREAAERTARERMQNAPAERATQQPYAKPASTTAVKTPCIVSWVGRSLLGAAFGILTAVMMNALAGNYAESALIIPLLAFASGLAGLITYPHRSTVIILIVGYVLIGSILAGLAQSKYGFVDFIGFGAMLGLPAGALISRILHCLRVTK